MPKKDSKKNSASNPLSATAAEMRAESEGEQSPDLVAPVETTLASVPMEWEQEREDLQRQLAQALEQERSHKDRIQHLEQALEQSQATVSDLRRQEDEIASAALRDRVGLEAQLHESEEVANLQQQALAQLKQQLNAQHDALLSQKSQAQVKDQTVQDLLAMMEILVRTQQKELESLRERLTQYRTAIHSGQKQVEKQLIERQQERSAHQQRVVELESQILAARNKITLLEGQVEYQETIVEVLHRRLSDRTAFQKQLEAQVKQSHAALEAHQDLHKALVQTQTTAREQTTTIAALIGKMETLETDLAQQIRKGAQLEKACEELTSERDRAVVRVTELESQLEDWEQEIIISHQQQAREYQAAIAYWKERYDSSQRHAQQLKQVLETLLPNAPDEIGQLLNGIVSPAAAETSNPPPPTLGASDPSSLTRPIDLPKFLRKLEP